MRRNFAFGGFVPAQLARMASRKSLMGQTI
jgi:hypothetical protein